MRSRCLSTGKPRRQHLPATGLDGETAWYRPSAEAAAVHEDHVIGKIVPSFADHGSRERRLAALALADQEHRPVLPGDAPGMEGQKVAVVAQRERSQDSVDQRRQLFQILALA